jgi:hypothetical protein
MHPVRVIDAGGSLYLKWNGCISGVTHCLRVYKLASLLKHLQPRARGVRFRQCAILQYSKTPSLRSPGFEDSGSTELAEVLPDVASRLVRHSLPEFRMTDRRRKFQTTGRSRDDGAPRGLRPQLATPSRQSPVVQSFRNRRHCLPNLFRRGSCLRLICLQ